MGDTLQPLFDRREKAVLEYTEAQQALRAADTEVIRAQTAMNEALAAQRNAVKRAIAASVALGESRQAIAKWVGGEG